MNRSGGQYQRVIMQNAATGTGNGTAIVCTSVDHGALITLNMQVTGISGDTITFEGTIDGSNWVAILLTNLTSGTAATTATANGLYRATITGLASVRARVSTYSAGTITVTGVACAV